MALKIKDNVDLEELKTFGFYYFDNDKNHIYKTVCEGRRGQYFDISISEEDKIIKGFAEGADGNGVYSPIDDTLFDIINAGFVEKVGNK